MRAASTPILRDIVLIGGGHSHVGVLRMLGRFPIRVELEPLTVEDLKRILV